MKKRYAAVIIALALFFALINTEVTIRRGVDYKVGLVKMPLYLKVLDFFDRHYNYKNLVGSIVERSDGDYSRVLKILRWTAGNIRRRPAGMPVMDDHVWYTIVRGYGADDQFADVFSTLCNYAGLKSFYSPVYDRDNAGGVCFSFVKVDGVWTAVDPYNAVCFEDIPGHPAGIDALKSGNYKLRPMSDAAYADADYKRYFENLGDVKFPGLVRPGIQSPLNRLLFEIKKRLGGMAS